MHLHTDPQQIVHPSPLRPALDLVPEIDAPTDEPPGPYLAIDMDFDDCLHQLDLPHADRRLHGNLFADESRLHPERDPYGIRSIDRATRITKILKAEHEFLRDFVHDVDVPDALPPAAEPYRPTSEELLNDDPHPLAISSLDDLQDPERHRVHALCAAYEDLAGEHIAHDGVPTPYHPTEEELLDETPAPNLQTAPTDADTTTHAAYQRLRTHFTRHPPPAPAPAVH